MMNTPVKRNILLNPGPATTTDTVKYAQVVPDICPRERNSGMSCARFPRTVRVVHGDPEKFTAVLFCGSGTINIDACISSLTPPDKKILIVNNGSYSDRGREVCDAYHMEYENLLLPYDKPASPQALEQALAAHPEVGVVYACHHETARDCSTPSGNWARWPTGTVACSLWIPPLPMPCCPSTWRRTTWTSSWHRPRRGLW